MTTDKVWFDPVQAIVEIQYKKESQIIEEACEKALVAEQGVLVIRDINQKLLSAEPHFLVPYGHIYDVVAPEMDGGTF